MTRSLLPILLFACCAVLGCGSSITSSSQQAAQLPDDPIALVVYEFLDGVRRGDTEAVSERLTPLAFERTRELDFAPPGSETATFEVGRVEQLDEARAVVESVWTELDAAGVPQGQKITCALKLMDGAWKVNGMAAELGGNQDPVVIDFENPRQTIGPADRSPGGARRSDASPRQAIKPAEDPFRTTAR